MRTRSWTLAAAAVVAAAAALRVAGLTGKSLWFDETYSIFIASFSVPRLLTLTAINDVQPPLYYLLLHVWLRLFGDGEAAVRSLSVLISVPVVLLTWLCGRRLVGPAAALLAAGLVALAPAQVAAGQEARMYGLLTLTALGSWWALWAAMAAGRRRPWLAYTATAAAMLYTHYYGLFVVAAQAAYLLWRRPPAHVRRQWVGAALGVGLLMVPWLPALAGQLGGGRAWPTFRPPLAPLQLLDALASLTVGRPVFEVSGEGGLPRTIAWALTALVAAAGVAGYRALPRSDGARDLLVGAGVLPVVASFAVSYLVHVFAPRYLVFALPPLALLMAAGVLSLGASRRWWVRAAAAFGLAVLVGVNTAALVRFYRQPRLDVFDWRQVSQSLAASAQPDDAIVFLPGFARIPVNYYFRGPQVRMALTPDGLDVVDSSGARLSEVVGRLMDHPRVWIVTVPPVPAAVDVLVATLEGASFAVIRRQEINMARLVLLERTGRP